MPEPLAVRTSYQPRQHRLRSPHVQASDEMGDVYQDRSEGPVKPDGRASHALLGASDGKDRSLRRILWTAIMPALRSTSSITSGFGLVASRPCRHSLSHLGG